MGAEPEQEVAFCAVFWGWVVLDMIETDKQDLQLCKVGMTNSESIDGNRRCVRGPEAAA